MHWVPTQAAGQYTVQRQYVPNVVAFQVPQTTYRQKVVTQKVPVQVTRFVDQVVSNPIQVQVCRWEEQEIVKPVTYTTQRIEWEERVEPVQVRVGKMVTETKAVHVPRRVAKWVPYTTTRMVPRTVTMRVVVDPCTGYAGTTSYFSADPLYYTSPPASSGVIVKKTPTQANKPVEAKKPAGEEKEGEEKQGEKDKDSAPTGDPNASLARPKPKRG